MVIVGYNRPPRAFAEFDDKILSNFTLRVEPLDLPRRPNAPRKLHHELRQRSLKEQHFFRLIDSAQYHRALIELMQIGWEVQDDPNLDVDAAPLVVPPEAPELKPPPPSVAWIRKVTDQLSIFARDCDMSVYRDLHDR